MSDRSSQVSYINSGKFAAVSFLVGTDVAFKTIHQETPIHRAELLKEFYIGADIYRVLRDTDFVCPEYLLYGSPASSFTSPDGKCIRLRDVDPSTHDELLAFEKTTFVFSYIRPVPESVAAAYRQVSGAEVGNSVRLIRLYLGRASGNTSAALQKASDTDPPIDLKKYGELRDQLAGEVRLPTIEKLCRAMGVMLGKLQWGAGVNGRDAELCLAGDLSDQVQLVIYDFNMCQRWLVDRPLEASNIQASHLTTGAYAEQDLISGARRLAMLISSCESYYPRPHQTEPYGWFKAGYQEGVKAVLCHYTPSPDESQEVRDRYQQLAVGYERGVKAFFETYEQTDKEKMERRARMSGC